MLMPKRVKYRRVHRGRQGDGAVVIVLNAGDLASAQTAGAGDLNTQGAGPGLRVGVIKDWDSRWYAKNELVGDLLVEDQKISFSGSIW